MQLYYIYIILLFIIIMLLGLGLISVIKYAPLKIKFLSAAVFIAFSLRYIILIILLLSKNIKYLYFLRYGFFLNLICVPIGALICLYIFARIDKLKFDYTIVASIIFFIIYIVMMIKFQPNINMIGNYGYSISFTGNAVWWGYTIVNTVFMLISFYILDSKNINKLGILCVFISSLVTIAEVLIGFIGIRLLPIPILGELFSIITLNYAIFKLKK